MTREYCATFSRQGYTAGLHTWYDAVVRLQSILFIDTWYDGMVRLPSIFVNVKLYHPYLFIDTFLPLLFKIASICHCCHSFLFNSATAVKNCHSKFICYWWCGELRWHGFHHHWHLLRMSHTIVVVFFFPECRCSDVSTSIAFPRQGETSPILIEFQA